MTTKCAGYSGLSPDNKCVHPPRFKITWPNLNTPVTYSCGQHIGWVLLTYGPAAYAVIEHMNWDAS